MQTPYRRLIMVACFAVSVLSHPVSAIAQTMEVSSYYDTYTDVDAHQQVFYGETADTSDTGPYFYHSDHSSGAYAVSTVSSASDSASGSGGGPWWLFVDTDDSGDDQFLFSMEMYFLCSSTWSYIGGGVSNVEADSHAYTLNYNYFSDEHYESQGHYDYSVAEDSLGRVCASEIVGFRYESLTGITMRGTASGFLVHSCSSRCSIGKSPVVAGEEAYFPATGSPICTPAVN